MARKSENLKWYLLPFSLLYGIVVSFRNRLFDFDILSSKEFDIPIISVGNITVGGTGKTPHVEYLIAMLKDQFRIATLSRGYKRKTRDFRLVSLESTVNEVGDEPRQIKQKFPGIDVAVDRKRVDGINKLIAEDFPSDLDVIILDDAYQHRYVKPGVNILLIDYNRPLAEDFLLPVGTLRERMHRKDRANIIIMAKSPENIKPIEQRIIYKRLNLFPYQSLYFTTFKYETLKPVFTEQLNSASEIQEIKEDTVFLLVTGIAYPGPLLEYLKEFTDTVNHLKFKDHHVYSKADILLIEDTFKTLKGEQKIIITTEKDAVRLVENEYISQDLKKYMYFLPVSVKFLKGEDEAFDKQIKDYVTKNKRNIRFHKAKNRL